jgi:hypothetical protein
MVVFAALANSTFATVNRTSTAATNTFATANDPSTSKYRDYHVLRAGSAPHSIYDISHSAFVDGRYQKKLLHLGINPKNVVHVSLFDPAETESRDWYSFSKTDLTNGAGMLFAGVLKDSFPKDHKSRRELVRVTGAFDLIITDTSSSRSFSSNFKKIADLLRVGGRLIMTDTATGLAYEKSFYDIIDEMELVSFVGKKQLQIKKYPSWKDYIETRPRDAELINAFYNFGNGVYRQEHDSPGVKSYFDEYSRKTGIVVIERVG